MSTTWTNLTTLSTPTWSPSTKPGVSWQRFPILYAAIGVGFGEGGFGEGGYGAKPANVSALSQPIWIPDTTS